MLASITSGSQLSMIYLFLIQDALHRIKTTFNSEFTEVFQKKEQEIAKIKDKNKRIRKIMEDLDLQEAMQVPELCAAEKPEMLLTVEDSEVSSLERKHFKTLFCILNLD